jgi:hypothetical protein
MAISFVDATTTSGNGTTLTINKPAGLFSGDMMIVSLGVYTEADTLTVTPPSGWTNLLSDGGDPISSNHHYVYYKIHTGSEAASYDFTWSGAEPYAGGCVGYTGTQSTITTTASSENATNVSNFDAPSITVPSTLGTMLTLFCIDDNAAGLPTFTPPSGQTERVDVNSVVDTNDVGISINEEVISSSGATGVRNSTCTNTGMWSALSLLLDGTASSIRLLSSTGVGK